jgi:hypothetical protein
MAKIYSIEFDNRLFIDPLNMNTIAREILDEYNNKETIKTISYIRDRCIMTTTLRQPKITIGEHYQEGIYITFFPVKLETV